MLEDAREGCHADTSTNEHGNLGVKDVLGRSTVRPINADLRKAQSGRRVDLDELAAAFWDSTETFALGVRRTLLHRVHSSLGERRNDVRASTNTLAEGMGKVSDLTDVDAHVRVFRRRGDGKRMPLVLGNVWDLDKEPLAGGVLEARLLDTQLHRTRRVNEDLLESGRAAGTDLTPDALAKVQDGRPDDETPGEVAQAVLGRVEREGLDVIRVGRVAHEAAGSVGEKTEHEEERKVVGVPERLEALLANFVMRGAVHQNLRKISMCSVDACGLAYHDEEHDMAGEASGLGVVDLQRGLGPNLCIQTDNE